ncbi:MAG: alpha/beta hydrolase [Rhodospirillaceae bacterium]|jgi:acylglycerol lipase|nr:alpha/beta hydrolase [Rhodospirillaceae bacterium]
MTRFWRLFGLIVIMTGCAPVIVGSGPRIAEPALTPTHIIAADGARLPLRHWRAHGTAKAVILGLHGFNDYSKSLEDPAKAWVRAGLTVYAYDQRGFGAAPGWGLWPGVAALADDLVTATRLIRARHPGLPLFVVGESMGAAVILSAVAGKTPPNADGYVLSAPAVWARHTMPVYQRAALWFGAHTAPWMRLTGRGLNIRASDNDEMLRRLGRDPLVIKGARVDALYGLTNLMDSAHAAASRLNAPTLILYGDGEQLIPAPVREAFLARLPPDGQWRYAEYPTGFHMLMRDLNADVVLKDIVAWMADSSAALPSGADKAKGAQRWARGPCPPPRKTAMARQLALAC